MWNFQVSEGRNNPAQWGGLDGKKNSGSRKSLLLESIYRTYQMG
jgi:hypothetical protein